MGKKEAVLFDKHFMAKIKNIEGKREREKEQEFDFALAIYFIA